MKIYRRLLTFSFLFSMALISSQNNTIALWEGEIPNSLKSNEKEIIESTDAVRISFVQKPVLEVFLPAKKNATGDAVIICPGGGYHYLSYDSEGTDIAKWFNSKGIAAFVLKYRLPNSKSVKLSYQAPLQDAQRAIRLVRTRAKELQINANKIGIMGFSAGGHLAATLGTQFDKPNFFKEAAIDTISARPDFMILIYPVITMKDDYTHNGSRKALLGDNPDQALIAQFSNELQVSESTPPTFIIHSQDDKAVPVENSLNFYKALKDKNVKSEMHIYSNGGHGYSLAIGKKNLQSWPERLHEWLKNF